jgi:ligand-binding SRPBCC domain-containing protein
MDKIEFNTHIKAPIQRCFDLARSVDFHKISLGPLKEESVAGCTSGLIGHNQHVLMQSRLWGMRFSTELKITKFNPPFFFSYEIADSTFQSIVHDYYFYDISEETVMVNHFYYKPRWGLVGEVINFIFLQNYLTKIITRRNDLLREYAESDQWKDILPSPKLQLSIVC